MRIPARALVLAALLAVGLAPAQSTVYLYGGVFRPDNAVTVSVEAPRGTELRLERLLDPAAVFAASPDPHRPQLPPGTPTRLLRTLRTKAAGYGQLDLGRLPSGLYVLRTRQDIGAILLVSDLGLVVKRSEGRALTFTAARGSGATRAARVWRLGAAPANTLAGPDGTARFSGAAPEDSANAEVYLARFGDDWAVSNANWNRYAAPVVRGYVYTDRPVYRPGQHVDFKGVLRTPNLAPLSGRAVRVTVFSPFDENVFQKTVRTNDFGSLSAGFDLPAGAKLGEYRFELSPEGTAEGRSDVGGSFGVEAYEKPEYEVTVKPDRARAVQGERVKVTVKAAYLFGGTLGGARVTYNVTRAPYYPPGFDTEDLGPDTSETDYGSDLAVREEARLNAKGELEITLPLDKAEDGSPQSYRVEAEVEDESRRTVSASVRVLAFPASVNVEASTDGYIYDAGKPIRLTLDARTLEDRPASAPVAVELVRQTYVDTKDGYTLRETVVSRGSARTGPDGVGGAVLRAPRGGGYVVRARVKDPKGRTSSFDNFVWVLEPGVDLGWDYRDLLVRLDRKTYRPGDTATVLIGNPTPGAPVLVTLEGDRLRSSTVLRGKGAALTYRFTVTGDMAPNIFVGAATLGNGNLYTRTARVNVPREDADLKVSVTPDKARYKPGDTGKMNVRVTDAKGAGVPAELALSVVDRAIYLVRPDLSTPLARVFLAPRENTVGTDSSLSFYFESGPLRPAPRAAMNEASFAQSKEEDAAASAPPEETPREDFRDTILWVPSLVTDANGRAEVSVRFPDNLTTWVATARAQTRGLKFGETTAQALTTKDLIARLSLPAFLVRGDTATLSGIVQSTLPGAFGATAKVSASGLGGIGGAPVFGNGAALKVPANGRARADFRVQARTPGTASVTFSARSPGGASDALKLTLPVKARGYEVTQTVSGTSGEDVAFTFPRDADAGTARLRLVPSPSLLGSVAPALEYLVGFPYGCTEQTMSRFLPSLLAKEALGEDALPASVRADLPAIVSRSVARLADFQHEDGGWGFWKNDDSTLEMTAYVVRGLARARRLGAAVDNALLDRGLKFLAANVAANDEPYGVRAAAYRALAEAGRPHPTAKAFARRSDLTASALASLALAQRAAGDATGARDLLDRLKAKRSATANGAQVYWAPPREEGRYWWYWDDNSVQVTATALEALARLEPASPLVPRVERWLVAARRGPRWISTQDTTSVVMAALALPKKAAPAPTKLAATLNGRALSGLEFSSGVPLKPGANTLRLNAGTAKVSFSAELVYAREPAQLRGDASRGFALTRVYEKLEPVWNAEKKRYVYRRTPLLKAGKMTPVTVGDLVLVTLTVRPTGDAARYLLVSDPIPAGMKALDERALAVAGLNDDEDEDADWSEWNYWYAGRDLLDDRVDLYADYLEGRQTMRYVLRARTPGTFTALPTHAFLMYDPDVEGYAPAATLTVRDRGE